MNATTKDQRRKLRFDPRKADLVRQHLERVARLRKARAK